MMRTQASRKTTDRNSSTQTTTNPTPTFFSLPHTTTAIMSDGEIEVESPSGYAILPKEVTDEIGSVKLFNKARPPPRGNIDMPEERVLTVRSGPTRRSKSATSH